MRSYREDSLNTLTDLKLCSLRFFSSIVMYLTSLAVWKIWASSFQNLHMSLAERNIYFRSSSPETIPDLDNYCSSLPPSHPPLLPPLFPPSLPPSFRLFLYYLCPQPCGYWVWTAQPKISDGILAFTGSFSLLEVEYFVYIVALALAVLLWNYFISLYFIVLTCKTHVIIATT